MEGIRFLRPLALLISALALHGTPGCRPSPQPISAAAGQQTLSSNQPVFLIGDEVNAIMAMRAERGDRCTLDALTTTEQIQRFWTDAARYILDTKYSTNGRNEYPDIATAYEGLAPNQKAEVIRRLATMLNSLGAPYGLLNLLDFNGACSRGLFIANTPFPNMVLSSVTNGQLLRLITTVRDEIATEGQPSGQPVPAVCDERAARALLRGDAALLARMLREYGGGFSIFDVDDWTGTVRPYQVRVGESTLSLRGEAFNFGGQLPTGLEVTFSGSGVNRTTQPITLNGDGSLSVPITVAQGTPGGRHDITVTIPREGQGSFSQTLTGGLEVLADRPAAVRRQPTPTDEGAAPRGYCDDNPNDSMCRF
jgi:hypothetical protein